jgi:hypothetical protein
MEKFLDNHLENTIIQQSLKSEKDYSIFDLNELTVKLP